MLTRLKELTAAQQDFAFESTLSNRSFAPFLRRLNAQGYQVAIYYFSLSNALLAVRRRFEPSLNNFYLLYGILADRCTVFDNSVNGKATLIATQDRDNLQIK